MAKFSPTGADRKRAELAVSDLRMWRRWRTHIDDVPSGMAKPRPIGVAEAYTQEHEDERPVMPQHEAYSKDGDASWSMTPEFRSDAYHTYLAVECVGHYHGWNPKLRDWLFKNGTKDYGSVMRGIPKDNANLRKWYKSLLEAMSIASKEWEDYRRV